ncbi:hypothetical protein LOK49_LG05G02481 [Camellia lanceoleosa]|uniref:Uncharacterized protein n=1 Tax=Camellia lanceoleosa TaxID=1840588 RepID=A0ACC0HNW6_9ERIC|nr:hypothetical protein LOK49_LG05G02481 [Camellia lanceoleosa]
MVLASLAGADGGGGGASKLPIALRLNLR